jgi:uncharacterized membrane protein
MNIRPLLIVNTILIAAMVAASLWAWPNIQDGAQIPVHWNLEGQVDRYGSKAEALLFMPVLTLLITLTFVVLWRLDPRRSNIAASGKMWSAIGIGVAALMAYMHVLLVLIAIGHSIDMSEYLMPAIGVLFMVIGNYLGKSRSNWFAGVRTPWTLSSEYSWNKTHRLGGWLFMGSGALTVVASLVFGAKVAIFVLGGTVIAAAIASVVASYVYWKNDPARANRPVNGQA